jgi:hypothetical protein
MQTAYREHSNAIIEIKVAPFYDSLRNDPRFQDMLQGMGLADGVKTEARTPKP